MVAQLSRSAYTFFVMATRRKVALENKDLSFADVARKVGKQWRELPELGRAQFCRMALEDKKRYATEKEAHRVMVSEASEQAEKDAREANAALMQRAGFGVGAGVGICAAGMSSNGAHAAAFAGRNGLGAGMVGGRGGGMSAMLQQAGDNGAVPGAAVAMMMMKGVPGGARTMMGRGPMRGGGAIMREGSIGGGGSTGVGMTSAVLQQQATPPPHQMQMQMQMQLQLQMQMQQQQQQQQQQVHQQMLWLRQSQARGIARAFPTASGMMYGGARGYASGIGGQAAAEPPLKRRRFRRTNAEIAAGLSVEEARCARKANLPLVAIVGERSALDISAACIVRPPKPRTVELAPGLASSNFRGVGWHVSKRRWRARIRINGKRHSLGTFASELEAALAYDRAVVQQRRLGNPKATYTLNFPYSIVRLRPGKEGGRARAAVLPPPPRDPF